MIFYMAAVLGVLSVYLVYSAFLPLTEGTVMTAEEWERLEDETLQLLQRRDRVFAEIRELEFESALNKVDPVEFQNMRRRYEDEALSIMSSLQAALDAYGARIDDDIDQAFINVSEKKALESNQQKMSAGQSNTVAEDQKPQIHVAAAMPMDDANTSLACIHCACALPEGSVFCDRCGTKQVISCAACGHENRMQAKFCSACGVPVTQERENA